jgi:hypothetical protein
MKPTTSRKTVMVLRDDDPVRVLPLLVDPAFVREEAKIRLAYGCFKP